MRKILILIVFCTATLISKAASNVWQQVFADAIPSKQVQAIHPDKFTVYSLQEEMLKAQLFNLSENPATGTIIQLPMPGGTYKQFKVWQASMMEPGLAIKFPEIKTFTAVAVDNSNITAKLDFTVFGFHAMVFDAAGTYFIDPFSNINNNGYYLCYYKNDIKSRGVHTCLVQDDVQKELIKEQAVDLTKTGLPLQQLKVSGSTKSTYRLALSCNGEYSIAVAYPAAPSISASLSAMTTSMNRVNGVYEREVGIHMNFIGNENKLIFTDPTTDPFSANNSGPTLKAENQDFLDTVTGVGTLAYDIGHLFSTGSGGIAELSSVCSFGAKAQGTTGQNDPVGDAFDIDFVAHEMGHQFGATHTLNSALCGAGNVAAISAYEPGSGSTIMGYAASVNANICGVDNLQGYSDDYFHAISLNQISDFINSPSEGGLCVSTSSSGNTPSSVSSYDQTYTIPYLTPFELIAPEATDSDHDSINYNWEEWDLGDTKATFADTKEFGPIFRSFRQTTSRTRIFPTLEKLLRNTTNYLGEKLPEVSRTLKFKLTVRDIYNGMGCFNTPSDLITLNVVSSAGPFAVAFPSDIKDYMQSGTSDTIKWNVANTDAAPVSCSYVDIMLSVDGGYSYPYLLAPVTPNDGSEVVTIPAGIYSAGCRIKIKGVHNVFFDISNDNFSIFPWTESVSNVINDDAVSIYPVPAKNTLHIEIKKDGAYDISVINVLGQEVYKAPAAKQNSIDVSSWAKGIYSVQLFDKVNNERIVEKVVVQ